MYWATFAAQMQAWNELLYDVHHSSSSIKQGTLVSREIVPLKLTHKPQLCRQGSVLSRVASVICGL